MIQATPSKRAQKNCLHEGDPETDSTAAARRVTWNSQKIFRLDAVRSIAVMDLDLF
jgi:hypothetical protein